MKRLVLIAALVGGACGATTDDRPRTLAYITDTVLAPSCAMAPCHSSFKREVGDQFDTVEAARASILVNGLVRIGDPEGSVLYQSITVGTKSVFNTDIIRMPFDAPMADADVALIRAWIEDGAEGAQCLPSAEGLGCSVTVAGDVTTYHIVQCPDGNIGPIVMDCPGRMVCSASTGTGTCVP